MASTLIPDFNQEGLLPAGVYSCDQQEFVSRFVSVFPGENSREKICEKFLLFQAIIAAHGIHATQWIDGSFVTNKVSPEDIDATTFCDYDLLNSLGGESRKFAEVMLAQGNLLKSIFSTHNFVVPSCGQAHPYFTVFEASRVYRRKWWEQTRSGQPKGYARMTVGDSEKAPSISIT